MPFSWKGEGGDAPFSSIMEWNGAEEQEQLCVCVSVCVSMCSQTVLLEQARNYLTDFAEILGRGSDKYIVASRPFEW